VTFRNRLGIVAFLLFLGCIPLANWMIGLLPVAPGLMAPSGVLTVGFALVLRDLVQRLLGRSWGLVAVLLGTAVSALVADGNLVLASGVAFLLSEFSDFAVYTPLQQRGLMVAVLASSGVGLVVDSLVFLSLAFHSLEFLPGQVVGKAWAVVFSIPLVHAVRRFTPAPA